MYFPFSYYKLYMYTNDEFTSRDLTEFFSWIKNCLCIVDFQTLFKGYELAVHHKNFQVNEIVFWLGIPEAVQKKMIDRYNSEVVDTYNALYLK